MKKCKLKVLFIIPVVLFIILTLIGCKRKDNDNQKVEEVQYTVISENDIPEALKTYIEDKKANPFKLSYADGDELYIVIGYGKQVSTGYNIAVDELYLSENNIIVKTSLTGPMKEEANETITYPFIIIKMGYIDKPLKFL